MQSIDAFLSFYHFEAMKSHFEFQILNLTPTHTMCTYSNADFLFLKFIRSQLRKIRAKTSVRNHQSASRFSLDYIDKETDSRLRDRERWSEMRERTAEANKKWMQFSDFHPMMDFYSKYRNISLSEWKRLHYLPFSAQGGD